MAPRRRGHQRTPHTCTRRTSTGFGVTSDWQLWQHQHSKMDLLHWAHLARSRFRQLVCHKSHHSLLSCPRGRAGSTHRTAHQDSVRCGLALRYHLMCWGSSKQLQFAPLPRTAVRTRIYCPFCITSPSWLGPLIPLRRRSMARALKALVTVLDVSTMSIQPAAC